MTSSTDRWIRIAEEYDMDQHEDSEDGHQDWIIALRAEAIRYRVAARVARNRRRLEAALSESGSAAPDTQIVQALLDAAAAAGDPVARRWADVADARRRAAQGTDDPPLPPLPKGVRDDAEDGAAYGPLLWVADGDPVIYTAFETEYTPAQARDQSLWWLAAAEAAEAWTTTERTRGG